RTGHPYLRYDGGVRMMQGDDFSRKIGESGHEASDQFLHRGRPVVHSTERHHVITRMVERSQHTGNVVIALGLHMPANYLLTSHAQIGHSYSSDTLTSSLPSLVPSNSLFKAVGALRSPSTSSMRYFSFPAISQGTIFAAASGNRAA